MTTTNHSRADALTDEQIIQAGYMHCVDDDEPLFQFGRRELLLMVRELLAASPVEQHEAAPADTQVCQHCDCAYPLHDLDCPVAVDALKAAPSAPLEGTGNGADERAAFLTWWCDDVPENMREGWKEGVDECLRNGHATDRLVGAWEGFQFGLQFARAPRTEVAGAAMMPPVKGVSIDGGYVIVTPAGGRENAPAIKEAILALAGVVRNTKSAFTDAEIWQMWNSIDQNVGSTRPILFANKLLATVPKQQDWQQKAIDLGFKYWRAPDAHGVECTTQRAVDLLQDLLGVEVDIKDAAAASQPAAAAGQEAVEAASTKIHQVWVEETSSWADVTPAYYSERLPSNRRIVYYTAPPAQVATRQGMTDDSQCAARYRLIRAGFGDFGPDADLHNAFVDGGEKLDAALDALLDGDHHG